MTGDAETGVDDGTGPESLEAAVAEARGGRRSANRAHDRASRSSWPKSAIRRAIRSS